MNDLHVNIVGKKGQHYNITIVITADKFDNLIVTGIKLDKVIETEDLLNVLQVLADAVKMAGF